MKTTKEKTIYRIRKFVICFALLMLAVLQPAGIVKKGSPLEAVVTAEASSVGLNRSKITLNVGKSYTLKLSGTSKKVSWSTSKKTVAVVSSQGKVTGKKQGEAVITAKVGKRSYSCTVTVKQPVTSVQLNRSLATLKKPGATVTLKASVFPANATGGTEVRWKSSNTTVATVASDGKVTAVADGVCSITAKAVDGSGKKASCIVVVNTSASSTSTKSSKSKTIQILLIGDSKTSRSDIPTKLQKLCDSAGKKVKVTFVKNTGLANVAANSSIRSQVTKQTYDYAILQEQTSFHQASMYNRYLSGVKSVMSVIRQKSPNCKIILRQTWMLTGHSAAYKKAACEIVEKIVKKVGIDICYDGQAFYYTQKHYSSIRIYLDNRHQNNAGAYLCACSIYYSIFGESPVGNSYTGGLSSSRARKLQKAAYISALEKQI